jgi:hypothetical protein
MGAKKNEYFNNYGKAKTSTDRKSSAPNERKQFYTGNAVRKVTA